jgi:HK97 family phage major capsid protein
MTITEKREKLVEYQTSLEALNAKAHNEKRDLTKEEQVDFDKILDESTSLRKEIVADENRAKKMGDLQDYLNKPTTKPVANEANNDPLPDEKRWNNLGEWFLDPEKREKYNEDEKRTMSLGNASTGGLLVPNQFSSRILSISPEMTIVRSRSTVLPAGTPPDAKITIPVFNQWGANGIYGGMNMQWIDEGGTKADNTPEFTEIELEPKEIGGSTIITDKLLRNAPVLGSWLETQYRTMVNGKEDYQFLRGNGVGKPQGIIGCAGEKTVVRNTASSVLFADVRSMLAAILADSWGKAVWIANQTVLPQIINLVDAAGNTLFIQGDATKNIPATLFGIPVIFTGKTPTLGNKGDLMLCDFSYYLIKDGSGPYFASSEHVYFTSNKTVVKMFKLVDGRPWVQSTLLLEDASTTVSPFVVLV